MSNKLDAILADMRLASDNMDAAYGTSDYPAAAMILALLARHYLRTFDDRQAHAELDAEYRRLYGDKPAPAADAVDPSIGSTGKPPTRV